MSRHRLDEVLARKKLAATKKNEVASTLISNSTKTRDDDRKERREREEREERDDRKERRDREERRERREREEREERERKERREREEREERERERREKERKQRDEESQDELSLTDEEDSPSYDDDVKEEFSEKIDKEDSFSESNYSDDEKKEESLREKDIKQEPVEPIEPVRRRGRPARSSQKQVEKFDERVVEKQVEKSVEKQVEKQVEKSPRSEESSAADDILNKSSLVRLLKASGVGGLFADAIDSSKEILQQIIEELCDQSTTGIINIELINKNINKHFKNGENDLHQDVYISPSTWDRYAKTITDKKGGFTIRRDASFLLQLYCESYLNKMVKAAEMVAASSKRARISGGDLAVAFHIYTM